MSFTIDAYDHVEWDRYGLQDYPDFSDKIHECNQEDLADCTRGQWFYIPDERLPENDAVIYHGTWGNDNSPGASSYTWAEIYDMNDPDDVAQYEKDKKHWKKQPEWA